MAMRRLRTLDVAYTHTEGEPTCIVLDGLSYPPDGDIDAKRRFLEENYDWLRRALLREPRGHRDMFGVFVTPAHTPDTHAGAIWADGVAFRALCGHGTIALAMLLVAQGRVPAAGDPVTLRFETTAGVVRADVGVRDGVAEWCRFHGVPTYVVAEDVPVDVPAVGPMKVDLVRFAASCMVLVPWSRALRAIRPDHGSYFSRLGVEIRRAVHDEVARIDPDVTGIAVLFHHDADDPRAQHRNLVVFGDGQIDRSPGGTGSCAMLAMLAARGRIDVGESVLFEGLLGGGTFEGCIVGETRIGNHRAVLPAVRGTAHLTGFAKWVFDPDDPVGAGFLVS